MAEQLKVMISSTARDLPEHREKLMHVCLRLGLVHPNMMEHLSAEDANAAQVSLSMVEDSDLYVGVFGFRYGYVPPGSDICVTEMEYNRAVERGIPRLIFLMHDDHPVRLADVETGNGAAKLKAFKERLKTDRVTGLFRSPDELSLLVFQSLSERRQRNLEAFHYISTIPEPPEEYIAHPYTLLQTHTLIGRQPELKLLTDWITGKALEFDGHKTSVYPARIMGVVAIGGMGKSALTWKWFNEVAPEEMKPLAGRMWWSFYESDATFENFVIRALAYVSKRTIDEVQQLAGFERESQLLQALDHEPFLIVLDGLERILVAYARMDATRFDDSEIGKEKNLRKTTDPRARSLLAKLVHLKQSRILISSRLYPASLETGTGDSIPGSFRRYITGLTDEDAVELWRAFGVSGSRAELLPLFTAFGKHPLLIQALAGEVKRYRKAPGNFDEWRKANPQFDPSKFQKIKDAMSHVLEFALRGLDLKEQRILQTIAAFRMPTSYDTLAAVLVGEKKTCANEPQLDAVLTELEERGLVGWDKRANRYDLHPIVRGVVWNALHQDAKRSVYTNLYAHFEAIRKIDDWREIRSFEELTPAIELYSSLVGLGRLDDASRLYCERLFKPAQYRLSASQQAIELLQMLFPDGLDSLPRLTGKSAQAFILNALALAYYYDGQCSRAASLFARVNVVYSEINRREYLATSMRNLSHALFAAGGFRESEGLTYQTLVIFRKRNDRFAEGVSLNRLGLTLAARGAPKSACALRRSLRINQAQSNQQAQGLDNSYLAQLALWVGEVRASLPFANRAWELAHVHNYEADLTRASRLQGEAALALNDFTLAAERLHYALARARSVNHAEEEIPALIALAELQRRRRELKPGRDLLDDVWELAERGPYPLFHANAINVLAQIERDEGNTATAIEAATKAYRLAWCDGPPFAYHWGLEKAKQHLRELGASEPEMPPFDESRFEPMPEVEIDPNDEFHVGSGIQP